MKAYRLLVYLISAALLAAFAVWIVGADPGYVLLRRGTWAVETTAVFALVAVVLTWLALRIVIGVIRWPLQAAARRSRRRARVQLERGLLALAEGRPQRANNLLMQAASLPAQKIPALLGAYQAARNLDDEKSQKEILMQLVQIEDGKNIAAVLQAGAEMAAGRAGVAIEILQPLDLAGRLPPAGVRVLVDAFAQRGRAREGLAHLGKFRRTPALSKQEMEEFETRNLAAAVAQASDASSLRALWADLNRDQRRLVPVALAYAKRAATLKLHGDAAKDIEGILKKSWSDPIAEAYGNLPGEDMTARLKTAEGWLKDHPNSPGLLLALGRLCRGEKLWGKAEEYFRRALSTQARAMAWQELAQNFRLQQDYERATQAYANAIAAASGTAEVHLVGRASSEDLLVPVPVRETRNEHGVPTLPPE